MLLPPRGNYTFLDDGRTSLAEPRSLLAAPESLFYVLNGKLHTYKKMGEDVGRMPVSQTPGGLHERFFEELGEEAVDKATPPAIQGPPDTHDFRTQLRSFRDSFYGCLERRADALFELAAALLPMGAVPAWVHLSPAYRLPTQVGQLLRRS